MDDFTCCHMKSTSHLGKVNGYRSLFNECVRNVQSLLPLEVVLNAFSESKILSDVAIGSSGKSGPNITELCRISSKVFGCQESSLFNSLVRIFNLISEKSSLIHLREQSESHCRTVLYSMLLDDLVHIVDSRCCREFRNTHAAKIRSRVDFVVLKGSVSNSRDLSQYLPSLMAEEKAFSPEAANFWTKDVPLAKYHESNADYVKLARAMKSVLNRKVQSEKADGISEIEREKKVFGALMFGDDFKIVCMAPFSGHFSLLIELWNGKLVPDLKVDPIRHVYELVTHFLALHRLSNLEQSVSKYVDEKDALKALPGDPHLVPSKETISRLPLNSYIGAYSCIHPIPTNFNIGTTNLTNVLYSDISTMHYGRLHHTESMFLGKRCDGVSVVLKRKPYDHFMSERVLSLTVSISSRCQNAMKLLDTFWDYPNYKPGMPQKDAVIPRSEHYGIYRVFVFPQLRPVTQLVITFPLLKRIIIDSLTFLTQLHSAGMVHMDMNPNHFFVPLEDESTTFIGDFDNACFINERLDEPIGHPGYCHPNVLSSLFEGEKGYPIYACPAFDLYSLGKSMRYFQSRVKIIPDSAMVKNHGYLKISWMALNLPIPLAFRSLMPLLRCNWQTAFLLS